MTGPALCPSCGDSDCRGNTTQDFRCDVEARRQGQQGQQGQQGHAWQDVTAGAELRQWRVAQEWTQTRASLWYGVGLRQWQRYELGESPIPLNLTRLIAWRERLGDRAGDQSA